MNVLKQLLIVCVCLNVLGRGALAYSAQDMVAESGIRGGLVVHLGCGDGHVTAQLKANNSYLIHGLDTNAKYVEMARDHIKSLGLYGKVSVDTFDGVHLPYNDNMVNLVVADDLGQVSMDEVARVLVPLGVAMVNGEKTTKLWPKEIDEWPQYLHGADNNAVAKDTVVGPPRHLKWVDDPAWGRSHMGISTVMSIVSSKGRLFSIEDRATPENPLLESQFYVIARDAFNGLELSGEKR